jgi:glycosyltransferase involved in cell wall biosynthesis
VRFGIDSHGAERDGEGNATYTRNLIPGLLATDAADEFKLFAADRDHPFYGPVRTCGRAQVVSVYQGKGLARLGWSLARAARRERVDALHVQYVAPLRYRGPLVITVHDLGFVNVPDSFPFALRALLRVLVPWSMARASQIITVSEFCRRDILARYPIQRDRITAIPLGVDTRFRPRAPDDVLAVLGRHGLRPGFFFSLGRLNRRKNLERLIQAYTTLRTKGVTEAPLVIGGKPDYGTREVRRRVQRSGEAPGVVFTGLIPDEDLPTFYSAAACFVYPSLFEGFGLPVLEAMACGTPVVVSNRAALPELVGEAGVLVDPENVNALAQAMTRVVTDRAAAADLRRSGLARSRQFSWEETAQRTVRVYRDALNGSGTRGSAPETDRRRSRE